jgi:hypothetical protein
LSCDIIANPFLLSRFYSHKEARKSTKKQAKHPANYKGLEQEETGIAEVLGVSLAIEPQFIALLPLLSLVNDLRAPQKLLQSVAQRQAPPCFLGILCVLRGLTDELFVSSCVFCGN